MRAREHVGELRPSQLLHTYGVGATVELPEMTTLVLGLDDWPQTLAERISRAAPARRRAGQPRRAGRAAPHAAGGARRATAPASRSRRSRAGCAARCAACWRRSRTTSSSCRADPWRPERTTYVHAGCPKSHSRRPPTAFPARYLMACEDGHLDDFPWVEFLHGGIPCGGTLRLRELGSGGRAGDVQLSCDQCRRRRRLSQAFGEDARPFLPPRCRGRHPHLGTTTRDCRQQPLTLLLGASNAWFPVQLSALSIPSREGELAQAVDEAWAAIEPLPAAPGVLAYALEQVPGLKKLAGLADERRASTRSRPPSRRGATGTQDGDPEDLRTPEWRVLRRRRTTHPRPTTSSSAPSARRGATRTTWRTSCSSSGCARSAP